jgi:hypothetical protein
MDTKAQEKAVKREQKKIEKRQKRKQKKNALVVTHDKIEFWTTQKQFWQWIREGKVVKMTDFPLCGHFVREDEEKMVVLSATVLNLACPNHLNEVLTQKRLVKRY